MVILSIDPGKTTGYVVVEVLDDKVKLLTYGTCPMYVMLESLITLHKVTHCVAEQFVVTSAYYRKGNRGSISSIATDVLDPVKVLGVVEYLCGKYNLPLVYQTAAARMPADSWNAKNPVYPHIKSHTRSALQHAIVFIFKITKKHLPYV